MTPIKIEPNSGTKMAGVKIFSKEWASNSDARYVEILYIGETHFFAKVFCNGDKFIENSLPFDGDWYLYEEPKAEVECSDRKYSMEERIEHIEETVTFIANILKGVEKV